MKQPPHQLSHLNRPGNPLAQLGLQQQQQQGNLSLGFSHPHPFDQRPSFAAGGSNPARVESGTEYSACNLNQLAGAYGHHWDLGHPGPQHAQNSSSPTKALEYPGESSRVPMSDEPANPPDATFDFTSLSHPADYENQVNAALPNTNRGDTTVLQHSPPGDQSYPFPGSREKYDQAPRKSNLSHHSLPEQSADQHQGINYFQGHVQPWDIDNSAKPSMHGNAPSTSSQVHQPEHQNLKRRKITERRREQNRAHQKSFRERREIISRQKDMELHLLQERVNQYEGTGRAQRKTINDLQARLDAVQNSQSNYNRASLVDYPRSHPYANSVQGRQHESLTPSGNREIGGSRQFLPTIPNAHQNQSGSHSIPWNSSGSYCSEQSLPLLENLEIHGNRHLAPTIPNSRPPGSECSSRQWTCSDSDYVPDHSLFNPNPPGGSREK
ncbi:hypothetical protein PCANC_20102 [Puccinia coronata f. sp. avenae]|uniref:BZIP domain-containing protein n=1 Tax=Puccinia coronata f. sp. avenae TaxID=200324 RepID=A0A2N5TZI5_9BASI|nr:hypothetical protein PCANC_20102 [Puccinia coronata f. sp. avenae]